MTRHDVWRRAREFGGAFYYQLAKNYTSIDQKQVTGKQKKETRTTLQFPNL